MTQSHSRVTRGGKLKRLNLENSDIINYGFSDRYKTWRYYWEILEILLGRASLEEQVPECLLGQAISVSSSSSLSSLWQHVDRRFAVPHHSTTMLCLITGPGTMEPTHMDKIPWIYEWAKQTLSFLHPSTLQSDERGLELEIPLYGRYASPQLATFLFYLDLFTSFFSSLLNSCGFNALILPLL